MALMPPGTPNVMSLYSAQPPNALCLLFQLTNHQELWAFIVTNLASVYIREGNRHQEVVGDMLHIWYPFFQLLFRGGWRVLPWAPANLSNSRVSAVQWSGVPHCPSAGVAGGRPSLG